MEKMVFHRMEEELELLRWPDPDVDLTLCSNKNPGAFRLVYEPLN